MSWCSATIIMDAALDAVTASVAAAWQIASGMEDVRTPEYVNALNADPELQDLAAQVPADRIIAIELPN